MPKLSAIMVPVSRVTVSRSVGLSRSRSPSATISVMRNAAIAHGAGFQVNRASRPSVMPRISLKSREKTLGAGCRVRFAPRSSASQRTPRLPFEKL